jgi:hypothetical protein
MSDPLIRVTIEDLATGQVETKTVGDDYLVIAAGRHYVAHTNWWPRSGTTQITIRRADPADPKAAP